MATTALAALLLGLLGITLLLSGEDTTDASSGDGSSVLETLPEYVVPSSEPPAPAFGPGPGATAAPQSPRATDLIVVPTQDPGQANPGPGKTGTGGRGTGGPGPGGTVIGPTPASPPSAPTGPAPTPDRTTPAPDATTTPRITLSSVLPASCEKIGQQCTYWNPPVGARTGSEPESVSVSTLPDGRVSISAFASRRAAPDIVGFVIRVCVCSDPAEPAVLVRARVPGPVGAVTLTLPRERDLKVWVQELNAAGLGPGVVKDIPARNPAPSATPTVTPSVTSPAPTGTSAPEAPSA